MDSQIREAKTKPLFTTIKYLNYFGIWFYVRWRLLYLVLCTLCLLSPLIVWLCPFTTAWQCWRNLIICRRHQETLLESKFLLSSMVVINIKTVNLKKKKNQSKHYSNKCNIHIFREIRNVISKHEDLLESLSFVRVFVGILLPQTLSFNSFPGLFLNCLLKFCAASRDI